MNKEQQELVNEAYIKYQNQTMFHTDDLVSLKELDGMYMSTGEKTKVYRQFAPKEFINKCKTDSDFSEKWGLKVEERELSLEERAYAYNNLLEKQNYNPKWQSKIKDIDKLNEGELMTILQSLPGPSKLITLSYHDKTIESYE